MECKESTELLTMLFIYSRKIGLVFDESNLKFFQKIN